MAEQPVTRPITTKTGFNLQRPELSTPNTHVQTPAKTCSPRTHWCLRTATAFLMRPLDFRILRILFPVTKITPAQRPRVRSKLFFLLNLSYGP
uniref:Uncharacterized protein n=1 Tax=Neogobius melanostomus TaxID=47308 RepID=A0A8C6UCE3_9GOBI